MASKLSPPALFAAASQLCSQLLSVTIGLMQMGETHSFGTLHALQTWVGSLRDVTSSDKVHALTFEVNILQRAIFYTGLISSSLSSFTCFPPITAVP